jgi:NitT/TauT family transport system substrate-binding protein
MEQGLSLYKQCQASQLNNAGYPRLIKRCRLINIQFIDFKEYEAPMLLTITRRQAILFSAGFLAANSLSSCNKQTPATTSSAMQPMRFGINPWPGAMPFKVAEKIELFKANGLAMELTLFPSISNMMDAFNSGNIDVTLIDPGTLLISAANGVLQKFVMVTDFSNGADAVVAVPSVTSLADLRGKTISVEMGSIGHFLLLKALEAGGISTDDVTLVNQTADAALAALTAGKAEVAVSYEPFITQAISQGKGAVLFSTRDVAIAPDVLSVREDFLERQPGAIEKLIQTWYQTLEYRANNLEECLAIESEALGVTVDEFKAFGDGVRLVDDPNEIIAYFQLGTGEGTLEQTTQEVSQFLIDQKLLDKQPPPANQLIENRFIQDYVAQQT